MSITKTTEEDKLVLHPYSNSRLTDVVSCPRYGVVHSQRRYKDTARAMALEAGGLMHEVFAFVRLWQIGEKQGLQKHMKYHGERIFGAARWNDIVVELHDEDDTRDQLISAAFRVLHTSDWYDEPSDDIRTMSNMELATIQYINERLPVMADWPIWIQDKKNPKCLVGTEQVFDVTLLYSDDVRIRFIGTVDGLVIRKRDGLPYLDENKTASRLDDAWQLSFDMTHQITGYCATSESSWGFPVRKSRVIGLKLKPGKSGEDTHVLIVSRDDDKIAHWAHWVRFAVGLSEQYRDNFEDAPTFTHSCNRYFRPCSLIPFCSDSPEGRMLAWEEMVDAPLSPSELAIEELAIDRDR